MADGQVQRDQAEPGRTPGGGWVPIPDPTTLTTEAVERSTGVFRREIQSLRETIETRLDGSDHERELLWTELHSWPDQLQKVLDDRRREFAGDLESARLLIEQRLDGMDKAIELAASELASLAQLTRKDCERRAHAEREYVMAQVEIVRSVSLERYAAVGGRFDESKEAVDRAFAAAKEAVTEQNRSNERAISVAQTGVKEQLTALSSVTDAGLRGLEDKIADARDRITAIENLTRGIKEATGEGREVRGETRLNNSQVIAVVSTLLLVVSIAVTIVIATRGH